MAISVFTGYLRLAADKHWLTDVLAGAAIGATVGILVPLLFHGRRAESVEVTPVAATPVARSARPRSPRSAERSGWPGRQGFA